MTADSVTLTYDALGRMAEQNKSGVYSQIVYSPLGSKFAIMNGSTLTKAFVPLSGGSQAVYTSSGLAYYRHSDWIGSSRFASTPTRTMYFDGAHAPYGEAYAETGTTDLSFTGVNQDTVTNLYDFPAREYNNIHGRWPSPDPAGISAVRLRNPQTWNRYAYVRNNPLTITDPTGMDPCNGNSGNNPKDNADDSGDCADPGQSASPPPSGGGGGDDPGPTDPDCPSGYGCDTDPNPAGPPQNQNQNQNQGNAPTTAKQTTAQMVCSVFTFAGLYHSVAALGAQATSAGGASLMFVEGASVSAGAAVLGVVGVGLLAGGLFCYFYVN